MRTAAEIRKLVEAGNVSTQVVIDCALSIEIKTQTLEVVETELVTLVARLPEPYRSNVQQLIALVRQGIAS